MSQQAAWLPVKPVAPSGAADVTKISDWAKATRCRNWSGASTAVRHQTSRQSSPGSARTTGRMSLAAIAACRESQVRWSSALVARMAASPGPKVAWVSSPETVRTPIRRRGSVEDVVVDD